MGCAGPGVADPPHRPEPGVTSTTSALADLNPVVVANEADLAAYAVAYTLRPDVAGGPSAFVYVSWGGVGVGAGRRRSIGR